MIGSDVITPVRNRIVEVVGSYWSDTELIELINDAEREINNKTKILEGTAFMSTIQGRSDYPLPANCKEIRVLMVNTPSGNGEANWGRINPSNLEKTEQEMPNFLDVSTSAQDVPSRYFIWNNTLYILPAPKTNGNSDIFLFFKGKPIPLVTAEDSLNIPDDFVETVRNYVLMIAWEKEQETDMADRAEAKYIKGIGEIRKFVKRRSADQRWKIDIDSPVGFSLGNRFPSGFNPF